MEIISYKTHVPSEWRSEGSFLDRNPNMSYLVFSGGDDPSCVLIDASADPESVIADLERNDRSLGCILLTHTHLDHTFQLSKWLRMMPHLRIGVHASQLKNLSARGVKGAFPLENGMIIPVGESALNVIAAPGHTYDSVCFWAENGRHFFSGDTIFGGGIGCSDYGGGGNRNIFYQTVTRLMETLPSGTRLYPGHLSEHYRTLPPYPLDEEKDGNPYLRNARQGRRLDFDRDLKEFSLEFENYRWVLLGEAEIEAACVLEEQVWIPELRAPRTVLLERMRKGHKILAIREDEGFSGMISWCYADFSVRKGPAAFPKRFAAFATCQSCKALRSHSAFIYSVGVRPDRRNTGVGSLLLQLAFERIAEEGIDEIFLDSRLPSYNGSHADPYESVSANPSFHDAIDRYFRENRFPTREEFLMDPAVRFYMENGLEPWMIIGDFIRDKPSGDIRVICDLNLTQGRELEGGSVNEG